jgi:hypothetical protein
MIVPSVWSAGAKGCMLQVSGQVTGCISTVAFSFIVQLPVRRGKVRWNGSGVEKGEGKVRGARKGKRGRK